MNGPLGPSHQRLGRGPEQGPAHPPEPWADGDTVAFVQRQRMAVGGRRMGDRHDLLHAFLVHRAAGLNRTVLRVGGQDQAQRGGHVLLCGRAAVVEGEVELQELARGRSLRSIARNIASVSCRCGQS